MLKSFLQRKVKNEKERLCLRMEENVMKKCMFEDFIDDYLLNRLVKNKENKFEEHYFNCPYCFGKMMERQEFISIVKNISISQEYKRTRI